MNTRFLTYYLFFVFCFIFAFNITQAQTLPSNTTGLVVEASPEYPHPGQEVTIKVVSYTIDVNAATISWLVDGKKLQDGVGATSLKVLAPALGKNINIAIAAVSPSGARVFGSYIVSSGSVDMIIESNGYIHPFFKGKLSPVYQNTLKITAIPHIGTNIGAEFDPTTLVYQWKKNGKVLQDQSGYGKQTVTITGDIIPRPYEMSVSVTPRSGGNEVRSTIFIEAQSPFAQFYINDLLYGILFNKTIGSTVRIGSEKETNVVMVPFGFNKPQNSVGDLVYTWLINSKKRSELSESDSIVLRAPEGSAGTSNIRLDIRNNDKILQSYTGGFSASFSSTPVGSGADDVSF